MVLNTPAQAMLELIEKKEREAEILRQQVDVLRQALELLASQPVEASVADPAEAKSFVAEPSELAGRRRTSLVNWP